MLGTAGGTVRELSSCPGDLPGAAAPLSRCCNAACWQTRWAMLGICRVGMLVPRRAPGRAGVLGTAGGAVRELGGAVKDPGGVAMLQLTLFWGGHN